MKQCSKCHVMKPETEFYRDSRKKDGLKCECKTCHDLTSILTRDIEKKRDRDRAYIQKWRTDHPEEARESYRRHNLHRNTPEKTKARMILYSAIRSGKIQRPIACQECGAITSVQGHHNDYSHPYEVEWLCSLCHGKRHRKEVLKRA